MRVSSLLSCAFSALLLLLTASSLRAAEFSPPVPPQTYPIQAFRTGSDASTNSVAGTNLPTQLSAATNPSSQSSNNPSASVSGLASMDTLDDNHKLAIGDKLSLRIVEDEEDPKPLIVTDSGELDLGQLGRFPAEKRTCRQLAREIKTELEKEYYFQATVLIAVDLMTKSRGRIYIAGAVKGPGSLELPSDETLTLSKAVLRAGGFTDFANKHRVEVTRKTGSGGAERRFLVDVGLILEKGKTEGDLPLEPDDLIFISERSIRL